MKKNLCLLVLIFLLFFNFVYATNKIDINIASLSELDELVGIGPKYAQAIIDSRPYSSIDGLLKVKGIGEKTLQKIKDQGLACVNCADTQGSFNNQNTSFQTSSNIQNQTSKPIISYPSGIYINEILPNPEGDDAKNEWIEIYNSNNNDVDLSGWQIQDIEGSITTYIILKNTKIFANDFLILERSKTKITLNNDTDGLNLLTPNKKIVDSVVYKKSPLGQSYNKVSSRWEWSSSLTKGATNIITTTDPKILSKTKKSVNNDIEEGLASLNQNINTNQSIKNNNPWFLFLTALAITIILAIIVLIIKFRVYKK